ncbi:proprotein convertase P-domain-containing protein [Streptomyces sp. NBC_00233]|uniref:proprotein convertase P-domain-containing protein n=1 Tax=Streptomyces sp. NBC_00233 TaxID=2975686 RepID=UPI0022574C30|nr:proprotein convertase P-domain-containing protein [Streptomyces sp. NBC_00233]MCX5233553.1 proprotein convertase P-domain-containing protein [Streptomyces sp. NBC_00233]
MVRPRLHILRILIASWLAATALLIGFIPSAVAVEGDAYDRWFVDVTFDSVRFGDLDDCNVAASGCYPELDLYGKVGISNFSNHGNADEIGSYGFPIRLGGVSSTNTSYWAYKTKLATANSTFEFAKSFPLCHSYSKPEFEYDASCQENEVPPQRVTMTQPEGASRMNLFIYADLWDYDPIAIFSEHEGDDQVCVGEDKIPSFSPSSFQGKTMYGSIHCAQNGHAETWVRYHFTVRRAPTNHNYYQNEDVSIPDMGTAYSAMNVDNQPGKTVNYVNDIGIDIRHTFRGDLRIWLIGPSGKKYLLKQENMGDSADNVTGYFGTQVANESVNGKWQLMLEDVGRSDTGFLNRWSMNLG